MGFFKKLFKGVKKVFKKIGRAVKKGVQKFGKFMNKIGIVGQIAMMFIMPHVGAFLMKGLAGAGQALAAYSGIGSTVVNAAGSVLTHAHKFATAVGNGYRTVTQGIMDFGKTALNKIPGVTIEGASQNFFTGPDSALSKVKINAKSILDPWKTTITGNGRTLGEIAKSSGTSLEDLARGNQELIRSNPLTDLADIRVGENQLISTTGIDIQQGLSKVSLGEVDVLQGDLKTFSADIPPAAGEINLNAANLDPSKIGAEAVQKSTDFTRSLMGDQQHQMLVEDAGSQFTGGVADSGIKSQHDLLVEEGYRHYPEQGVKPNVTDTGTGLLGKGVGTVKDFVDKRYFSGNVIQTASTIKSDIASVGNYFADPVEEEYSPAYGGGYIVDAPSLSRSDFEADSIQFANNFNSLQTNSGQWGHAAYVNQERNVWQNWSQRTA